MVKRTTETRPVSPDKAAEELIAAGRVGGLAQTAALEHASELAAARAVRLQRESLRMARKYGNDAPETLRAARRIDQHASYSRALKLERDRAALPVPSTKAGTGIVYGRVFAADGKLAASAVVMALDPSGEKMLGRSTADANGTYLVTLETKNELSLFVRALDPKGSSVLAETDSFTLNDGMRVFRDLRASPAPAPAPDDGGPPQPGTTMPNLVGLSEAAGRANLARLGISAIKVTTVVTTEAPAGQVIKQAPPAGSAVNASTAVELVVAAQPQIKVPDLSGMILRDATVALNRVGLKVGKTSGDLEQGRVKAQKPAAGQDASPGAAVDLNLVKPG